MQSDGSIGWWIARQRKGQESETRHHQVLQYLGKVAMKNCVKLIAGVHNALQTPNDGSNEMELGL